MRVSSDIDQFYYDFGNSGALSTLNSNPSYNVRTVFPFTLEVWAFTSRLYGCCFVHVQNTFSLYSFYIGLNGGGRLELATDTPFTVYGDGEWAPNTNSWFYVACVVTSSQVTLYARQAGQANWSKSWALQSTSRFVLPQADSYSSVTLARRSGGDYQYQGRLSNVRWTNRALSAAEVGVFPLEPDTCPETTFCVQGVPAKDLRSSNIALGLRGNGTVAYGNMPALGNYII
jgi:hypothetical protein